MEVIMSLPKRYNPKTGEIAVQENWNQTNVYAFDSAGDQPVFSIDTPPATVSGHLHLGHLYSYSHTDFIARYWRMQGYNVFYPMGYDDNGLPTGRLVEQQLGIHANELGREQFINHCLQIAGETESAYEAVWRRLGLSVDWRYSYRTISQPVQKLAQWSFLDLFQKGLAYQDKAPVIWCPECQTAIAQAEVNDLARETTYYTLAFGLPDGQLLPVATTRPELLPACVAVFVHPDDGRYQHLVGQQITIPYFDRRVPLLADSAADPHKGTGAVMCCTFGDTADIAWWRQHDLPLIEAIGPDGRLTKAAGPLQQLTIPEARQKILQTLQQNGQLLAAEPAQQTVPVHERCDTPVEHIVTRQWFISILPFKEDLLAAGEKIQWHPAHMQARYQQWVENLGWDWCISRQRYYGVPIPVWTCAQCGAVHLPDEADLPVNPLTERLSTPCPQCQSTEFNPESDVFDTWFTSSLTPQIAGRFQNDAALYQKTFPFTMRPQAHEIIRTWAFYTIVKSYHHFQAVPFEHIVISGWGLAPEGAGKLSKSRGGGPVSPLEMMNKYSADAVRYWAASTAVGKDATISEEKIQAGDRLVTKLWHVSRFSQRFLLAYQRPTTTPPANYTLADRWLLAHTHRLIERATSHFAQFDYAAAKNETEAFFWRVLADNYLEMAKLRLYGGGDEMAGAQFALYQALLVTLKLFAPILPHVTDRIFGELFAADEETASIHRSRWPATAPAWQDEAALTAGDVLVAIATAVRRYKSHHNLPLGTELSQLTVAVADERLLARLTDGRMDLQSITRAKTVIFGPEEIDQPTAVLDAYQLKIHIIP